MTVIEYHLHLSITYDRYVNVRSNLKDTKINNNINAFVSKADSSIHIGSIFNHHLAYSSP